MDIILKFLVYLAKKYFAKTIYSGENKLDFFLIFPRKRYLSTWGLYVWSKYSYSCSLKQFIERSVHVIYPLQQKWYTGMDNTYWSLRQ